MSPVEGAGPDRASSGDCDSEVDPRLLDDVDYARVIGPLGLLAERLVVRCEDAELGAFLAAFLGSAPPVSEARSVLSVVRVREGWAAYLGGRLTLAAESARAMARSLVWELNRIALVAPSDRIHVHAAVVAGAGQAMVLPGVSGAGKSTLALALTLAGWDYLSDEVAAFDGEAILVHPYPRPVALDPGSWGLFPASQLAWPSGVPNLVGDLKLVLPSSLGSGEPPAPAVPRWIVFPEVRAGASTSLEPLERAEAVRRLVPLTFNLGETGQRGVDQLIRIVRYVSCHRLVLDGIDLAPTLLRELGRNTGAGNHAL